MKKVLINDKDLGNAALEGADAFLTLVVSRIREAIGGEPTADEMEELSADQQTLLAWDTMHEEVMDGGFVQLIYNGYGPYIFKNPFAKALNKLWHMRELSKLVYEAHTLYAKYGKDIEKELTDDAFMALYEQMPEFDDLDDQFVLNEERYVNDVAQYVDENLEKFITIV